MVDGSSVERVVVKLLEDILQKPSDESFERMRMYLETKKGESEFMELLLSNYLLAYIYLKQKGGEIGERRGVFTETKFLQQISKVSNGGSRKMFSEYLDTLSTKNALEVAFIEWLIKEEETELLAGVYRKYLRVSRSNELFREIERNINLTEPLLRKGYIDGTEISKDPFLLDVVYELLAQDIHPFFEDNSEKLFKAFGILSEDHECHEKIINIYELFVTRYPDCTDYHQVINTLTKSAELIEKEIKVLTQAFEYSYIGSPEIIKFLSRILSFDLAEEDAEDFTRGILKNVDSQNGSLERLIRALRRTNEGLVYEFRDEQCIYIAAVLREKNIQLINQSIELLKSQNTPLSIVFISARYLISINQYITETGTPIIIPQEHLTTPARFIVMKFIVNQFSEADKFHSLRLGLSSAVSQFLPWFTPEVAIQLLQAADAFSSELLLTIIKSASTTFYIPSLVSAYDAFFNVCDRVSVRSFSFVMDSYIVMGIRSSNFAFNTDVVQKILSEEIVNLYDSCFFYIAVLVSKGVLDGTFLLEILSKDQLWTEKSWHASLVLLSIAGYNAGYLSDAQILSLAPHLAPLPRILLAVGTRVGGFASPGNPLEDFLLVGKFNQAWFLENHVERMYVRLVLKQMLRFKIPSDIYLAVAAKNSRWIEYETLPHGVTEYFDL